MSHLETEEPEPNTDGLLKELADLRRERAKFASQLKLFEAMSETIPVGVVLTDANGKIIHGNSEMAEMVRHPILHSEDADAYGEWVAYHEDGRRVESSEYPLARVIREKADYATLTVHYQRGDGTRFWMRIIGEPIHDERGELIGAAVACVDVDEEYTLRESQRLLIAELNHRVKNAFSVTNAIVGRSLRNAGIDRQLREELDARLTAYAAAHSKLVGSDWRSAPIREIVREVLGPIAGNRLDYDGDPTNLPTRMALSFSMAFYELASNAVKYGSLSVDTGKVILRWRREMVEDVESVVLSWVEKGGPQLTKATRKGFGSFITGQALVAETGGTVSSELRPDGFEWHLTMPLPEGN